MIGSVSSENSIMSKTKKEIRRASDSEWWERMLPKGWRLSGFTNRYTASAIHKETGMFVELNGKFLCDLYGLDARKEMKCP